MADPLSPQSPGTAAFGRKSSLFSKKIRNAPSTVAATVTEEEEQLEKVPFAATNGSATSLASSPDSPRRSLSIRSHKSQNSGSIHVHKARSPSLSNPSAFEHPISPQARRRFSRTVSASVTQTSIASRSPQKPHEELRSGHSPGKSSALTHSTSQPTSRSYHMLAHLPSRRPSEAPSSFSYGSLSGSSAFAAGFGAVPNQMSHVQPGSTALATYNHISETCVKRMATLDYIRKVYVGFRSNLFMRDTDHSTDMKATVSTLVLSHTALQTSPHYPPCTPRDWAGARQIMSYSARLLLLF